MFTHHILVPIAMVPHTTVGRLCNNILSKRKVSSFCARVGHLLPLHFGHIPYSLPQQAAWTGWFGRCCNRHYFSTNFHTSETGRSSIPTTAHDLDLPGRADRFLICMICVICMICMICMIQLMLPGGSRITCMI